jgi:hypothetical protein
MPASPIARNGFRSGRSFFEAPGTTGEASTLRPQQATAPPPPGNLRTHDGRPDGHTSSIVARRNGCTTAASGMNRPNQLALAGLEKLVM